MNALVTRVRDKAAKAALRIAKKFGIQVTFQNPGEEELTCWALIESSSRGAGVHTNVDTYDMVLLIPRQELGTVDFPPDAGIATGATVTVNAREYAVEEAESDMEDITNAVSVRLVLHVLGVDETI